MVLKRSCSSISGRILLAIIMIFVTISTPDILHIHQKRKQAWAHDVGKTGLFVLFQIGQDFTENQRTRSGPDHPPVLILDISPFIVALAKSSAAANLFILSTSIAAWCRSSLTSQEFIVRRHHRHCIYRA
jgi:hypothetical protein